MRRRLSAALAAPIALAAVLFTAAPALADCPGLLGNGGTCPYTSVEQTGQRSGGVLRFPQAIAIAPDGKVYVGDQGSHTIQVFDPNGAFLRDIGLAGTRPGELTAIGSLGVAGDGTIFVADGGTNRISRFSPDGRLIHTFGGSGTDTGRFRFGAGGGNDAAAGGGIAVSGNNIYVSDTGNDRVQRFELDGGRPVVIVGPGTLANPRGLTVRGTRLLVADDQNHRLAIFDTGGKFLKSVGLGKGAGPGQLNFPYDVATDAKGRTFVADDMNQRIVRYSGPPNYPYKARWGSYGTGPGNLAYPRGIATDAQGNLFVTNTGNDRIDVFDLSGSLLRSFGSSGRAVGQFDAPTGVAADAAGLRAVADSVNGRVQLLNPDGSVATVWGSPNPGPTILPDPVAVAFDGSGNGYVLDQRRSRILFFERGSATSPRSIGSPGNGPGQMLAPSALTLDGNGTLWVADTGNERIVSFRWDGTYLGSFRVPDPPRGIAATPAGDRIYVSDSRSRITAYDPSGRRLTQFGGRGRKIGKVEAPAQMTLDTGGRLWVADRGNNRVQLFGPNGERLLSFGSRGTGPGQFIHPTGVSVDCNGKLTVTDGDNNRVQTFQLAAPLGGPCTPLATPAEPPVLQFPTLPAPEGPLLSVKVLRRSSLLSRGLPVRVGCDTPCSLTATVTLVQRNRPRKGHRPVSVVARSEKVTIPAGATKLLRFTVRKSDARKLRRALRGHRGVDVTIALTAAASVGQPTSETERVRGTV